MEMAVYAIADQLHDGCRFHVTVCNIFAPSVEKFPAITKVGDILRCHRVKAQTYQVSHLRRPQTSTTCPTHGRCRRLWCREPTRASFLC